LSSILTLTAPQLFTPAEVISDAAVVVEDGVIAEVFSRGTRELPKTGKVLDFPGTVLVPGFVDMHIHGAAGYDVMRADAEGTASMERFLAARGVTSYCPTTVTAPEGEILNALERLGKEIDRGRSDDKKTGLRAHPLGIHLEGPFISHAKRGVHPEENILPPSPATLKKFFNAAEEKIAVVTLAPEIPGALETITAAKQMGICVSLGHTDGDMGSAERAITAGARHATHTFNAMRPLGHRQPGVLGAVLTQDALTADIIADGIHVSPSVVKLFLAAKGQSNAVLITDAVSATGMPDGSYPLGAMMVEVKQGRCTANGRLAGSVLTMDVAVRNVMKFAAWSLQQAVALATVNPARVLGSAGRKGILARGADADIVALSKSGEVIRTFVGGRGE
jgi:N-acetylglucosamine-6-phosphate deacetylase